MTDTFQHPDGHHYRCVGYAAPAKGLYRAEGSHMTPVVTPDSFYNGVFFERVEPPLWPWTGPSGRVYQDDGVDIGWNTKNGWIPLEDFAGLAERLFAQHNRPNEEAD